MAWTVSGTGTPLYEHNGWTAYWKKCEQPPRKRVPQSVFGAKFQPTYELPFVDVVLYEGGGALRGKKFTVPRLPTDRLIPHPLADQYYRDWKAGKFVIPGLKVSIKDKHEKEYGPAECKLVEKWNGRGDSRKCEIVSAVFQPLKQVRLDS